jgi:hypothetical protein
LARHAHTHVGGVLQAAASEGGQGIHRTVEPKMIMLILMTAKTSAYVLNDFSEQVRANHNRTVSHCDCCGDEKGPSTSALRSVQPGRWVRGWVSRNILKKQARAYVDPRMRTAVALNRLPTFRRHLLPPRLQQDDDHSCICGVSSNRGE